MVRVAELPACSAAEVREIESAKKATAKAATKLR
jgi:hypothetical protein